MIRWTRHTVITVIKNYDNVQKFFFEKFQKKRPSIYFQNSKWTKGAYLEPYPSVPNKVR
jgi:hypothetical protein